MVTRTRVAQSPGLFHSPKQHQKGVPTFQTAFPEPLFSRPDVFYQDNIDNGILSGQYSSLVYHKLKLMNESYPKSCTAFAGSRRIASGELAEVALKTKEIIDSGEQAPVLIFDDLTSEQVEVDTRGSAKDVLARLEKSAGKGERKDISAGPGEDTTLGPGRPKLGVIGREVTLLPRHWDWLNSQPGGASATLRRLVEAAKRANAGQDRIRLARESTYRFMAAMAGNLPGFEEATRVLFAKKKGRFKEFEKLVCVWPGDIRRHVSQLMKETIRMEEMPAVSDACKSTV